MRGPCAIGGAPIGWIAGRGALRVSVRGMLGPARRAGRHPRGSSDSTVSEIANAGKEHAVGMVLHLIDGNQTASGPRWESSGGKPGAQER